MLDPVIPLASPFLVPDADGIALLTLERPTGPNMVDDALVAALGAVLATVDARDDVRGLIITSAKPHFLLGRDPATLKALAETAPTLDEAAVHARLRPYAGLLRHLAGLRKPTVAALNGAALGAGLELALACTVRLAADEPSVRFGFPDVRIGFMPMAGGTQRLARLIGGADAATLLLDGRTLAPERALELGLVDGLVPGEDLVEAARQWLRTLIADGVPPRPVQPLAPPPVVLRSTAAAAIHSALAGGAQRPLDAALDLEMETAVRLLRQGDAAVLLRTLVGAKAAADRAPWRPNLPTAELPSALVLGSGTGTVRHARWLRAAGMAVETATGAADLLRFEGRRVSVVVDTTRGPLANRAALLGVVERTFGDDTLIILTGGDDPVERLAAGLDWADRVVGLHLPPPGAWAPAGVAEVTAGPATSAPARSIAVDLARLLGRTPFTSADAGPRYLARLQAAYLRAALDLAARGYDRAAIEATAGAAGYAEGPLTLARRLGLDGVSSLLSQGEAARLLAVLKGTPGAGLPGDAAALLAPVRAVARHAVDSGLVPDAPAADLAAVLGLGWPAATGGPLESFAHPPAAGAEDGASVLR